MRTNNINYTRFTNVRATKNRDELTPEGSRSTQNIGVGLPNFTSTNQPASNSSQLGDIIYSSEADQISYFSADRVWKPIDAPIPAPVIPAYLDFFQNQRIDPTSYTDAGESVPIAIGRVSGRAAYGGIIINTSVANYPKAVNNTALTMDVMVTSVLTMQASVDTTTVTITYAINDAIQANAPTFGGVLVNLAQEWQVTGAAMIRVPAGGSVSLYMDVDKDVDIQVRFAEFTIQELRRYQP